MAMGRPVVASHTCAQAITARGEELVCASGVNDYVREMDALLKAPTRAAAMGRAARLRVLESYSWTAHLGGIDRYLEAGQPAREAL
jgi:polysaccharide biosynthesis protein PslH